MASPIEIHTRKDVDLSGSLVVVGAPSIGFVGSITSRFLIQQLGLERVGGFHSDRFPPYTLIEDARPMHLIRVHTLETSCGLDLDCKRLVVVSSEVMPGPNMVYPLARAMLDWTRDIDAEMVIVPDGMPQSDDEDGEDLQVHGVGTTQDARELLQRADVQPLEEGLMVGLTAALLSVAEQKEQDLACLVTATAKEHPDARAAARLTGFLDKILPDISIDKEPLMQEAERIESKVKQLQQRMMASKGVEQGPRPDLSMFH